MGTKNIILALPLKEVSKDKSYIYSDFSFQEPYPLQCLEAMAKKEGYSTKILTGFIDTEMVSRAVEDLSPIALGICTHSYTYAKSLQLAQAAKNQAKKMDNPISIIFGGYHATAFPEQVAAEESVDIVVIGEGDLTLIEILKSIETQTPLEAIDGIAYKKGSSVNKTKPRERIINLDDLPFPERHQEFLSQSKCFHIIYPPISKQNSMARISYSRGCPFECEFCSSKTIWNKTLHYRSASRVVDELEMLHNKFQTNLVGFTDLTFNANREKTIELCEELIQRDLPIHWWALIRADLLDEELIRIMKEAKCIKMNIGIESPNEFVANKVKSDYRISENQLQTTLNAINNSGILIKAYLMIGFEDDTINTIREYKKSLLKYPIDELQVTFATPMPGSKMWEEAYKKGLITDKTSWDEYTLGHPFSLNPKITKEELTNLRWELLLSYYKSSHYLEHIKNKTKTFPLLKEIFCEYFYFIRSIGFLKNFDALLGTFLKMLENLT